ncbi:MAG: cupin domain-containing protein [Phycisphaerales bacterium]|nr:cupin domain-containing protein [Phycisphaerae bacterium]NNF43926.1 cupin domain-containing protein [Phycisphaerales bacterium]NNM27694.1 cupin domain-containing protein [Phycisphaerales bacterium]
MTAETTDAGAAPLDEAIELAGLVSYGDESVVSRTLLKSKTGTISLFAFDAGQALSEHTVPFDAFVQVLDGCGEFTIADRRHEVRVGQAIILPANIPHAVHAVGRMKMLLTMLRH